MHENQKSKFLIRITPIEFNISENIIEEVSNPVNNNLKTPQFLEGRLRKKILWNEY